MAEILLDDVYQEGGVLVRLEGDVIGNVLRVVSPAGGAASALAGAGAGAATEAARAAFWGGDSDTVAGGGGGGGGSAAAATTRAAAFGGLAAKKPAGAAASLASPAAASGAGHSAAAAGPAGFASPAAAASDVWQWETADAVAAAGANGYAAAPDAVDDTSAIGNLWDEWQRLQADLGDQLTNEVLEACSHDIQAAIQVRRAMPFPYHRIACAYSSDNPRRLCFAAGFVHLVVLDCISCTGYSFEI